LPEPCFNIYPVALFVAHAVYNTVVLALSQIPLDTVVLGDCLELLRSLPDGCADLVVSSPPYNLGKEYEAKRALCAKISETPSLPAFSVGGGEGTTHENEAKWYWVATGEPAPECSASDTGRTQGAASNF
jgi:hypothetical protein